jgi:hypothetical protein
MSFTPRRTLATSAVSALLAVGALAGPAAAAPADPAACTAATAQLTTARDGFTAARLAVKAANRPIGKLMAAERAEARKEVRTSVAALRQLKKATAKTHDKDARKELQEQARKERADIRHSSRLLGSRAALLAQVRSERAAAKAAFAVARKALHVAREAVETACADAPEPTVPDPTTPDPTTPDPTTPDPA